MEIKNRVNESGDRFKVKILIKQVFKCIVPGVGYTQKHIKSAEH